MPEPTAPGADAPKRPRGRPRRDPNREPTTPAAPKKPAPPGERLLYSLPELTAAGLGCHSFLYQQASAGLLRFQKIMGKTVVTKTELDRYLENLPDAPIRQSKRGAA